MATKSDTRKESPAPSVFAGEIDGFTTASKLSRRESDIVISLIRNITNSEEIAKSLGISTHTVNNHLKSIFEKTSTKSKTEILSTFLRFAADRLQSRNLFVRTPKVLIVDDEEMICEFVASGLKDRGMRTYTLTDPTKTVEMISKFNVDFVVCDIRMPEMNGMDVLKAVRAAYRSWPFFLFITGYPDYSLEECMHYGATGFVEKPLEIDRLFRTIMGHLVESSEERASLLQIDPSHTTVVDGTYALEEGDLGYGGAFLPMDIAAQKKSKVGVGSIIDVTVTPPSRPRSETMRVRGQVVWKRANKDDDLRAGVGLRFLELKDHDRGILDGVLRHSDVQSFIPMGATPHLTTARQPVAHGEAARS
jgi:FixJ family two-component response regulator